MLVHSYLYYEENTNIVSDSKWSQWAMELVQLQNTYPQEASVVEYADMFKDWDGSSGAFLQFPEDIRATAYRLLNFAATAGCRAECVKPIRSVKQVQKKKPKRTGLF